MVNGKTALITGASQGLGLELASRLYAKNCSVILVARRDELIQKHVVDIIGRHGQGPLIKAIAADVSDYDQCVKLWQRLDDDGIDPDVIFCCVGSTISKLFGDLSGDELSLGINTNYTTTLYPVHTQFKQALKKTQDRKQFKHRHVVILSSVAAVYPLIGYSQYAPMKAALMALSLTLRQELVPYNYRISCVFPGNFASEGYAEEEKTKPAITKKIEGPSKAISVAECADKVLDGLDRGYDVVFTDLIGWVLLSASLGAYPRYLGFFQVIVSFIFLIIAPILSFFVDRDIESFFKKKDKKLN